MRTIDSFACLNDLGRPVVTTAEASVAFEATLPTATKILTRLAAAGLVRKIRQGLWQVGQERLDPSFVIPVLINPFPSYISGWSALFRHGMIEQIPNGIFVVSLDRARIVKTTSGEFQIHHIHPDLFGGFTGESGISAGTARPEKALFDTVYLYSVRHGAVTLPELELPKDFDHKELHRWEEAIPSQRLKTMTKKSLERLLAGAT